MPPRGGERGKRGIPNHNQRVFRSASRPTTPQQKPNIQKINLLTKINSQPSSVNRRGFFDSPSQSMSSAEVISQPSTTGWVCTKPSKKN